MAVSCGSHGTAPYAQRRPGARTPAIPSGARSTLSRRARPEAGGDACAPRPDRHGDADGAGGSRRYPVERGDARARAADRRARVDEDDEALTTGRRTRSRWTRSSASRSRHGAEWFPRRLPTVVDDGQRAGRSRSNWAGGHVEVTEGRRAGAVRRHAPGRPPNGTTGLPRGDRGARRDPARTSSRG